MKKSVYYAAFLLGLSTLISAPVAMARDHAREHAISKDRAIRAHVARDHAIRSEVARDRATRAHVAKDHAIRANIRHEERRRRALYR